MRPLSYPNTDCFLLCYSIAHRASFDNILAKWYPELQHYGRNVPIVLIGEFQVNLSECERIEPLTNNLPLIIIAGTKSDLRVPNSEKFISTSEAKKMKSKIKAAALVECSALNRQNLENVFHEAVRAAIKKPKKAPSVCCIL